MSPMAGDIVTQSLVEIAEAIRIKQVSSVEVTKACIARAEAVQPKINCFIQLLGDEALETATARDDELARGELRGPLHGVPLAHKDMYYRKGRVSTCGSKIRKDYVAETTSTGLERLEAAGAIYLGGLNMAEFATGPTGHNEHWGRCGNAWNPDHISGGSSSGSGASVGARVVFGSLGSDTGGSIRLPSIMNGVVGLKPTNGLTSRYGMMPLSYTMDTSGALTRTVRDNARITDVIAGHDPNDPTTSRRAAPAYEAALDQGIEGLRIGVPKNYFYDIATDEIRALAKDSLRILSGLGAEIIELDVPDMHEPTHMSNIVFVVEACAIHERWLRERPQDYQAQVRSRYEPGLYMPATKYVQALSLRAKALREFVDTVFSRCDVLHTPAMPFPVPSGADTDVGASQGMAQMIANISWCTRAANYIGLPALCVPCGFTANGLPTSLQLMGRPFSEALLFRVGHAYQGATDWHARIPKL